MQKRENLKVAVLPEHKRALQEMARVDGEPVSVVLRQLIRQEAKRRGCWPAQQANEGAVNAA